MKNLFKSLMLVAVAAMAFTACTETNDEVNAVSKKTVFEFTADFNNDTRSGFDGKNDDGEYISVWKGGEQIVVAFSDSEGVIGTTNVYLDSLPEGVESTPTVSFEVEYDGELPEDYTISVYSGSWYRDYATGEMTYNMWTDQRGCSDKSVASDLHLCKAADIEVVGGVVPALNLTFETVVAYGKVSMPQFAGKANDISEVKVFINDNEPIVIEPNVLNEPTVWFAWDEIKNVTSLTVEATVGGTTYVKTNDAIAEGALSFNAGRVRPINVVDMVEKPADYNVELAKVTKVVGNTITFVGEDEADYLTIEFNPGLETIGAGTYECVYSYSSDSALQYVGNNCPFNLSAAHSEWGYYLNDGSVVVTDLGDDNFNIVATAKAYILGSMKSVKFTYEGKLAVEDAEVVGATIFTTLDVDVTTVGYDDAYFTFSGEKTGTLKLNFYNMMSNDAQYITPGTYTSSDSYVFTAYGTDCSYYQPNGGEPQHITNAIVKVSVTEDKQYHFDFIIEYNDIVLEAEYTGVIGLLEMPDPRTKLENPTLNDPVVNGNEVTLSWNRVVGADEYLVQLLSFDMYGSQYIVVAEQRTSETSVTFTELAYSTYHVVNFQTIANEDSENYLSADLVEYTKNFYTEAEPVSDDAIKLDVLVYTASASNVHVFTLKTNDGQHQFDIAFYNKDVETYWIPPYSYQSQSLNVVNGMSDYFSLQYSNVIINGEVTNVNPTGSTLEVVTSSRQGNHKLKLTLVTAAGDTYNYVFDGDIQ